MELLKLVLGWSVALFVLLLGLNVLLLVARGTINLEKLISEENGDASMSRFQLLVFTFVIAMSLFLVIISKTPVAFPDSIPGDILTLLGISGGSYLLSKGIQASRDTAIAQNGAAGAAPPPLQGAGGVPAAPAAAAPDAMPPAAAPPAASFAHDDGSVG